MSLQMLRTTIPLLFLMAISCTSKQHVEFLGFEGCPNTPDLHSRLVEADSTIKIIDVDLMTLQDGDSRLGWGAPTILVNGHDLFGVAPSGGTVSCRNWSEGLPTVDEITIALQEQE